MSYNIPKPVLVVVGDQTLVHSVREVAVRVDAQRIFSPPVVERAHADVDHLGNPIGGNENLAVLGGVDRKWFLRNFDQTYLPHMFVINVVSQMLAYVVCEVNNFGFSQWARKNIHRIIASLNRDSSSSILNKKSLLRDDYVQ